MNDLIGKEDALKVLDMFLCKQCDLERTSFAYDQSTVWGAVKMATDALAGIGKQAAEPAWIPVSERLPKERGRYLVYSRTVPPWKQHILNYDPEFNRWFWDGLGSEDCGLEIKAWMPLPEPYEETEGSE